MSIVCKDWRSRNISVSSLQVLAYFPLLQWQILQQFMPFYLARVGINSLVSLHASFSLYHVLCSSTIAVKHAPESYLICSKNGSIHDKCSSDSST